MANEGLQAPQESFSEGYIQELVKQNRIPLFIKINIGVPQENSESRDWKDEVMVVVPPLGIQPGDQYEISDGGTYDFLSPEGESRGKSEYYYVSPKEAKEIKRKFEKPPKRFRFPKPFRR